MNPLFVPEYDEYRKNPLVGMLPCVIIIDCRSKAMVQQQEHINAWLRGFLEKARRMLDRKQWCFHFDTCVLSVGNTVETLMDFTNGENFSGLTLQHGTGASLDDAVEKALDLLDMRKAYGYMHDYYRRTPKLYIFSTDIINYCFSLADSQNELYQRIHRGKINFYPMTCLPEFLPPHYRSLISHTYLPTLETPLDEIMYACTDYMGESICDPNEDENVVQTPPTLACITFDI